VVGDVAQVVEDPLTGSANDDRHCQGIHGDRQFRRRPTRTPAKVYS
jgi:hypothetical protein